MATMPSSPPRRIHSRHSSNSSQYSFDLDALMPPDEHDSSSLVVQQPSKKAIDVVDSEDIDGPTDFTQNMEYWMSTKLPTVMEPTKLEGALKNDMEEYIGGDDAESTTKHMHIKRNSPVEAPLELPSDNEFDPDKSDMSATTPRRSYEGGMTDSFFNDIPHGDESTPRTVEPASPLSRPVTRQATVEDYEESILRPRDLIAASSSPMAADDRNPESAGPSETEKALETALNQLREELASVRTQMEEQQYRQSQELTDSKASYETKLAQLQSHAGDAGLEQARQLDASEALNRQRESRIRSLEAHIADQDDRLEEAKREIVTLSQELDELGADKIRIQDEESILQKNHDVLQTNTVKLEQTVRDLERQVERATNDHVQELQRAYDILRGRHARLEETVKDLEEEVNYTKTEHDKKAHATSEEIEQLRSKVGKLQEENAALRINAAEKDAEHRQEISTFETAAEETVSNAREVHCQEQNRLKLELETTKEENSTFRTEIRETDKEFQRLRCMLQDQSSTHIEMLTKERDLLISKFKDQKSKHAKSQSGFQSTISTLQAKVKELSTTNTTLKMDLQSTTDVLSKTHQMVKIAELETKAALREKQKVSTELKMLIEKTDAINVQFDKAVNELMREKEREWRARFQALKKERGVMSKVLMKEWGEKECGTMEPNQGYRYKYV
jgi:hypothetical protein